MYGIIDCDNCYVSCERVFRPDLKDTPIVVLSNNDGCVVARSNEAKKLGIKAGVPYYQLEELFPDKKIAVFSSNYELYGELTGREGDGHQEMGREPVQAHQGERGYARQYRHCAQQDLGQDGFTFRQASHRLSSLLSHRQ